MKSKMVQVHIHLLKLWLFESDRSNKIRKCHENSSLKAIYEKYLTLPCSNTAHKYLHTYYTKR